MKIDIPKARGRSGSRYPKPFDEPCLDNTRRRLGAAAGLTQFGVNLLELAPGAWSSQLHWHGGVDEFVYVLAGAVMLVGDGGETLPETGDCDGFKAGDAEGHHLQNRGIRSALILEIGTREPAAMHAEYPDIDHRVTSEGCGPQGRHTLLRRSDALSSAVPEPGREPPAMPGHAAGRARRSRCG